MTSPTGRKGGAPRGNHNALTHGFFAKHFTPEELKTLHKTPEDLQSQIEILMIYGYRIATDLSAKETYNEADLRKIQMLMNIFVTIGTLKKDQAFLFGKVSSADRAIEEALTKERERWLLA
jgi:hypothetical protein